VLDVATGTGHIALEAARVVGPRGRVVGIDLAAGMLARARENAGDLPVEFRRMDAETLEFDDGIFDVVLCGFAVWFLPNIVQAMREMHRVLRSGGTVAFSTFRREAFQPHGRMMAARFGQYGILPPPAPTVPWMALREPGAADPAGRGGLNRDASWAAQGHALSAADEYWDFGATTAGRGAVCLSHRRSHGSCRTSPAWLRTDQGIWLNTSALSGSASKRER
jgi:SAM-dependent methyltransferase